MEKTPTFFEIGMAFFAVIGMAFLIKLIIEFFFKSKKSDKMITYFPDDYFAQMLFNQGYIFCNNFKISDVVIIARKMGIALNNEQVALVVKSVNSDFDINTGIDAHRISIHIRMVVKQQLAKQRPI